jgi:hypothetical protein
MPRFLPALNDGGSALRINEKDNQSVPHHLLVVMQ